MTYGVVAEDRVIESVSEYESTPLPAVTLIHECNSVVVLTLGRASLGVLVNATRASSTDDPRIPTGCIDSFFAHLIGSIETNLTLDVLFGCGGRDESRSDLVVGGIQLPRLLHRLFVSVLRNQRVHTRCDHRVRLDVESEFIGEVHRLGVLLGHVGLDFPPPLGHGFRLCLASIELLSGDLTSLGKVGFAISLDDIHQVLRIQGLSILNLRQHRGEDGARSVFLPSRGGGSDGSLRSDSLRDCRSGAKFLDLTGQFRVTPLDLFGAGERDLRHRNGVRHTPNSIGLRLVLPEIQAVGCLRGLPVDLPLLGGDGSLGLRSRCGSATGRSGLSATSRLLLGATTTSAGLSGTSSKSFSPRLFDGGVDVHVVHFGAAHPEQLLDRGTNGVRELTVQLVGV